MYALPPDVDGATEPQVTGVTCPECAGVLRVIRTGHTTLRFICRVGHTMSADELLVGKEETIEDDMWAVVRTLEELVRLLEDLEAYGGRHGRTQAGGRHEDRVAQARTHIGRLRRLLDEKRPLTLTLDESPPC